MLLLWLVNESRNGDDDDDYDDDDGDGNDADDVCLTRFCCY